MALKIIQDTAKATFSFGEDSIDVEFEKLSQENIDKLLNLSSSNAIAETSAIFSSIKSVGGLVDAISGEQITYDANICIALIEDVEIVSAIKSKFYEVQDGAIKFHVVRG